MVTSLVPPNNRMVATIALATAGSQFYESGSLGVNGKHGRACGEPHPPATGQFLYLYQAGGDGYIDFPPTKISDSAWWVVGQCPIL